MFDLALLSTASSGGSVVSGVVLAAGVIVALLLIALLEKKTDENIKAQKEAAKAAKAAPAPKAAPAVPAPKAPAPAVENGIPAEVVAAIAAAVTCLEGGAVIHGIRRAPAAGSRRGVWGDAGVAAATTPFMA